MDSQLLVLFLFASFGFGTLFCGFFWLKYNELKRALIESTDQKQKDKLSLLTEHLNKEQKLNKEFSAERRRINFQ